MAGRARAGLETPKKSVHARARERVVALRQAFREALAEQAVTRFVFVEETSTNLTYCRRYGRTPDGPRVPQALPLPTGPNSTLSAALPAAGFGSLLSVEGGVNGDMFATYLGQVLGPSVQPGEVVVWDKLAAPQGEGLAEILATYGARFP